MIFTDLDMIVDILIIKVRFKIDAGEMKGNY